MSFGFGVSDFIAVGELIVKIINTLHDTQSEYRELSRELEGLRRALSQVDKLQGRGPQAIAVDQIKCAALTCKIPLEDFLAKIQKYDKHLGSEKNDKIKTAARKVQFAFKERNEANALRNYLNIHIGTINMLLLRQGFEMLHIASESMDKNYEELRVRIEDSTRELKEVRGNAEAQTLAVKENNSILRKLLWMVNRDYKISLRALSQTVAKVCVSTQQIYLIVLELRASLPGIDTRFTYFQDPVKVEDVLGRVFPFSSECSIEALNAEIRVRFKEGHGRSEVMAGNFEIFNAKDSEQVLSTSSRGQLLHGMSVNMAIILEEFDGNDKCPMPRCQSKSFVNAIGGGRTCCECQVWFDGVSKQRKRDFERQKNSEQIHSLTGRDRDGAKRIKTLHPDLQEAKKTDEKETTEDLESASQGTSLSAFKRIRFQSGLQAEAVVALPMTTLPFPTLDHEKVARLTKLFLGQQEANATPETNKADESPSSPLSFDGWKPLPIDFSKLQANAHEVGLAGFEGMFTGNKTPRPMIVPYGFSPFSHGKSPAIDDSELQANPPTISYHMVYPRHWKPPAEFYPKA